MLIFRLIFILILVIGDVLLVGDLSLSFFLFNFLLFFLIFVPHFFWFRNKVYFFLVPFIMVMFSYVGFSGIRNMHAMERQSGKSSRIKQIIHSSCIHKKSLSAYQACIKKMRSGNVNKKHWSQRYEKQLLKSSRVSFWKHPLRWYEDRMRNTYHTILGMVNYQLYGLYLFSFFTLIYTIGIFASPSILSAVYALLTFFVLPIIFSQLSHAFLGERIKFLIASYTFLCVIILIGYLRIGKIRK